ncbi:MAG: PA14 domain-containing protein, partial [Kiritimatiellaeota bacterium]|nr:PA14 domain-containing protein [Kiritimatiellota bacterium]
MRKLRMGLAALVALAGAAVLAAPNLLINLDATDFDPVGIAWTNNGTLGGTFVPVGNGSGTIAETVEGVPAVTFTMRSRDAMMTNGVSPNAICGKAPWAFEVWVFNPSTDAGSEDVFAWTARNNWPNGPDGSCMEFRYGNDVNNAVEHYNSSQNLPWGGAVPTVGQWHHVACTRDAGGTEKLYLDGTIRVSAVRSGINIRDDVGFFTLAGVMSKEGDGTFVNVEQTFSGSIARLRIYDGPLTTIELVQNYLAECAEFGITPVTPPSDQFIWIGTPGMWETWDTPANWLYGSVPTDDGNVSFENKGKAGDYADTRVFKSFAGADGGFGMTNGLVSVQDASNNTRLGIGGGAAFDFRLEGGKFEVRRMPGDAARSMHVGADGGYGEAFIGGGVGPAWLCADQDVAVPYGNMSRGYMEILPGGLVTVSNGNFIVSHGGANPNNATGTVVVAGGTFRHMRNGSVYLGNYNGAQAKLIVNDGSVETPGDIRMSDAANAANVAELFLNGGVTWIRKFSPQNTAVATNIVYLNGGVLRNREGLADFMQGLTAAYVQAGGAHFDIVPNIGTVVGVSQPLLDDPSSPGGGLVKTGPGILELRGNNTFTGNIVVEGGCLYLRSAGALPPGGGPGSILLKNGAGISYEVAGGVSALLARIDPASVGTIVLHGANASDEVDLSGHPGLTFGFAGGVTYNPPSGTYTPPASGQHRFSVFGGNNYYDYVISGGDSVVLEANSSPSAYLVLRAGNTFTGGADILGGVLEMQNATALGVPAAPGVRDIGIYNGAALKLNNGVSATLATGIVARIKTDSRGVLLITGNNNGAEYDLTQLPGISISADGGLDYDGTLLTPHPTVGYHLGGGPGVANSDGLKIRNLADGPGGPRGVVVDYPGNPVRLWTNNTFTGGIVVTNGGAVSMRDSTSMGAIPPVPVADHLYISGGFLRPNPDSLDVPYMESHPNHGLTVGEGGMTVYTPANRFFAWRGDLHGTGAITNMDTGAVIFGGAGNTWEGSLILSSNSDDSTFAVGWGNDFSWVKTNVIQGNAMFGIATDLDITWSDAFEKPLGTAPLSVSPSFDTPEGISSSVGLRKLGAGTLTLDIPNTYRRMTRVDSGTLKVGVADAIPWGGSKGNLHVNSNNLFPAGVLDLNGFDVNVNGFNGGGIVTDLTGAGKTLTVGNNIGNNGQIGTFFGTVQSPAKLFKIGDGTETFAKGADVNSLTIQRKTVNAGAETSFGSVTLLNNDSQDTVFSVGDINGLTGEYYWFDFPGLWSLIDTNNLLDIDVFNTFLDSYAPYHIQSSVNFGDTFDTGWTGGGAPGSKFQNGFNGRSNFYGRWTGEFYAEEDGVYEFATASDDGSVVYVNRELVVSNSRSQSYNINDKRSGTIELTKGWHDILIGYLQQTGERGLTVFMTPPGGEEDPLPQSLLRPYPVTL